MCIEMHLDEFGSARMPIFLTIRFMRSLQSPRKRETAFASNKGFLNGFNSFLVGSLQHSMFINTHGQSSSICFSMWSSIKRVVDEGIGRAFHQAIHRFGCRGSRICRLFTLLAFKLWLHCNYLLSMEMMTRSRALGV
jgi:hypothetical protein